MMTGKLVINLKRNAWNPTLLEITVARCTIEDARDAWAIYGHQQRFADDCRDALKFLFALHLVAGLDGATDYRPVEVLAPVRSGPWPRR
jgi:RNaseH domain of pPIWI_RE